MNSSMKRGLPAARVRIRSFSSGATSPSFEEGPNQLGTGLQRELVQADPVVIGLATPGRGVLGAVEEDQEDGGFGQPADQVVQELLGGAVDPVQVLDDQDEGLMLALPEEQVAEGLEDPLPLVVLAPASGSSPLPP